MTCGAIRTLIVDRPHLSDAEWETLHAHLLTCPACAAYRDWNDQTSAILNALPNPTRPQPPARIQSI